MGTDREYLKSYLVVFFIYSFQKSQIKCAVFSLESENTHPPYSTAHYTVHIDVCKSTKTYGNILI